MVRTGRPPKDELDRKGVYIQIRMSAEERAAYKAAANKAGTNTSEWARRLLSKAAGYKPRKKKKT